MPIRGFPAHNVVAAFDEPNQSGAIDDFNAGRNAPARFPAQHLSRLVWHSECQTYEIAAGPTQVTINHTALATQNVYYGVTFEQGFSRGPSSQGGVAFNVYGAERESSILLLSHGLGYIPKVMVAYGGRLLPAGHLIQDAGANGKRHVSVFATASGVYLRELAIAGFNALPAVSRSYTVLVFRTRQPDPAQPLFGKVGGNLVLARGIINGSRRYLRRTGAGDSPFSLNNGPTIDVNNGAVRTTSGGVAVTEVDYGGAMPAPPFVQVGV